MYARKPKPIRLYSTRQRMADMAAPTIFTLTYVLAIVVAILDVFVWRPN